MRLAVACVLLLGCATAHYPDDPATVDGRPSDEDDAGIDADTCAGDPCELVSQCGCATDEACDLEPEFTGATACRVAGAGQDAALCSRQIDCASGHVCAGGHCRRWCDRDDQCGGEGGLCVIEIVTGQPAMPIPGAIACSASCSPVAASNSLCPSGWGCHIFSDDPDSPPTPDGDERYLTDCSPAGAGTAGSPCTSHSQCAPTFDCITTSVTACRASCICPNGNCAAGTCATGTCTDYVLPAQVGQTVYGVCL